jgi:hypothetical protein
MSYSPIQGSNSPLFWAYNSTAQTGVQIGDYFEVDTPHEITGHVSGGVILDATSLVYGEMQTSGTVGQLDKVQTRFQLNTQAEGKGFQVATNKADAYDCDDGTYAKSGTGNQFLRYNATQISPAPTMGSGVDQTRIFGFRVQS